MTKTKAIVESYIALMKWFSKVVPRLVALPSTRKWLEMPHPRPAESETLKLGPAICVLIGFPSDSDACLLFP